MTKWFSWVVMFFCLVLGAQALGDIRTFFSSQESVEQKMTQLIDESRTSIDIALFELRSPSLIKALQRAERRGVLLRLVLDASHREDDLTTGKVRWLGGLRPGGRGLMHNKFALFDQAKVVTGSYNWTPGAEHSNYENALLTDDKETVKSYLNEFERLWERAEPGAASHVRKKTSFKPKKKRHTLRFGRKKTKKS